MKKYCTIPFFIVHQGCPFKCVYCDQRRITGKTGDKPEDVLRRVEQYLSTVDPCKTYIQVGFFGGSFTAIPFAEQLAFFRPLERFLKEGVIKGVRISTRPDMVDPGGLKELAARGLKCVELGVQSASDKVLEASRRGYRHAETVKASGRILNAGLRLAHQLMLGLPESNIKEELYTARETIRLGATEARIYPLVVIKDTFLAEEWKKGKFTALSIEEAAVSAARIWRELLSHDVKVIRCGLHASETLLTGDAVLDGPFHPAFGAMVRSLIYRDMLESIARRRGKVISLEVASADEPYLRGYDSSNADILKKITPPAELVVKKDARRMCVKAVLSDGTGVVILPGKRRIKDPGDRNP